MAYDIFSEFYDTLTDNAGYEKRADYFCRLLSSCNVKNGILLDLACGTGSMSVRMAQRGFDVIGADISVGMLNKARQKAYESGCDILLLNQSAEELDLYGTVDAAICVLDSINHFDGREAVKKAFENVSLFMNKGGAFAFDVNTVYKHRFILGNNSFIYDCDSIYCAWQNTYNESDDSVNISLDFFSENDDGTWERSYEEFTEYAYPVEDIKKMLEESGFTVEGIYDDMTFENITESSERAVFLAKKV